MTFNSQINREPCRREVSTEKKWGSAYLTSNLIMIYTTDDLRHLRGLKMYPEEMADTNEVSQDIFT